MYCKFKVMQVIFYILLNRGKYIQIDYLPPYCADIQAIAGKHKLCLLMVFSTFKSNQT